MEFRESLILMPISKSITKYIKYKQQIPVTKKDKRNGLIFTIIMMIGAFLTFPFIPGSMVRVYELFAQSYFSSLVDYIPYFMVFISAPLCFLLWILFAILYPSKKSYFIIMIYYIYQLFTLFLLVW